MSYKPIEYRLIEETSKSNNGMITRTSFVVEMKDISAPQLSLWQKIKKRLGFSLPDSNQWEFVSSFSTSEDYSYSAMKHCAQNFIRNKRREQAVLKNHDGIKKVSWEVIE